MFSFEIFYSAIIGFLVFSLIGAVGLAFRNYNRKFNLLYLAFTLAIIGFFICDMFFQSMRNCTISDFVIFEKGTNFFLLMIGIILIQLVSVITGYSNKWVKWCFSLPLIYFIISNAILPFGFYYSHVEKIETVRLVMGILYNTPIGQTSQNVAFISLYFVFLGALVIRSTIHATKSGVKSGGVILSVAFIPGILFQFLSAILFLLSGKINLPAILLSEFGLFYVTLLLGAKNFSDALALVGATNSSIESEERYRLLADHMTDTIWLMDWNMKTYYVSPSIEKIRGFSSEEIFNMPLEKHMPEGSLQKVLDTYNKEMNYLKLHPEHSFVVSLELEFFKKNGTTYWSENTFSLIRDKHGIPNAILGEGRDITLRKLAEAKIKQLSRAVEQSPVSIIIIDANGVVLYTNAKVADEYDNIQGVSIGEKVYVLNEKFQSENDLDVGKILRQGLEWQGEIRHARTAGTTVWENISISPIKNEDDGNTQFLIIIENISTRKKLEDNLIFEKEKALEMSRLKSSFLANMSHELRTPMIGILGYSELVIEETQDENIKYSMEIIYNSASRLMDTLNLILHLSRIEAGKMEIEYNAFDVIRTIQEVLRLFTRMATRKSLYLKLETEYEKLVIISDEKLMREIVSNLVNNGIKFTDQGGVIIKVEVEKSGSYKWLVIKICDTGIGIARETQALIWEEFRQVSEGHNRSFEGTGLGLTITKKFVEKLKGNIVLESELNAGSVFTLKFPLLTTHSSDNIDDKIEIEREHMIPDKKEPIKLIDLPIVLYVEDDYIAVQWVTKVLRNTCKLDVVNSAAAALQKVKENAFAAILMDINLGRGEDGVQATRAIRKLEHYKDVPIVAVTAYVMEGDREEFLDAGCSHYIAKPFTSAELKALMAEILPA
jgi:PAS domain S-box-containing protein